MKFDNPRSPQREARVGLVVMPPGSLLIFPIFRRLPDA